MSAAVLTKVAPAASTRILADVSALVASDRAPKEPALERLEQAIGRDFADRLVAALSEQVGPRPTLTSSAEGASPARRRCSGTRALRAAPAELD